MGQVRKQQRHLMWFAPRKVLKGGYCPLFEKMAKCLEKWACCENPNFSSVGTLSPTCKKLKDHHHMSKRKENKHIWYDMLGSYEGQTKVKDGSFASLCRVPHNNIRSLLFCDDMLWHVYIMWVWLLKAAVRHFCILDWIYMWSALPYIIMCVIYGHRWVQKGHQRKGNTRWIDVFVGCWLQQTTVPP